jgi:hypothetical protein
MDPFDPELWFHRRAAYYVEAQLLYHLNACGLFAALKEGGPATVEALAAQLSLKEKPLRAVLEFVAGMDPILERDAHGAYGLTPAGHQVLERYSRPTKEGHRFNLFDVRVGAYAPVWDGLGRLLRGEAEYGVDIHRNGAVAAEGVYKVSAQMAPGLSRVLGELDPSWEVELGVTTGLLELMAQSLEERQRLGLDRSPSALKEAERRALGNGVSGLSWVEADVFHTDSWLNKLNCAGPGVFFSVHFHEFMAQGADRVQALLRSLGQRFPGAHVVALEHPAENDLVEDEVLGLYAQANRLIHHLIGNGQVLCEEEWIALFEGAGCTMKGVESLNYLGYKAFVAELGS